MDLETLGYTKEWLEAGLIDNKQLEGQLREFELGEDVETEHYRYRTLKNWLKLKSTFTDTEVADFLKLTKVDADRVMASAAVHDLLRHRSLSDTQFVTVVDELSTYGDWTEKVIARTVEKRKNTAANNR